MSKRRCERPMRRTSVLEELRVKMISSNKWSSWWRCCLGHSENFCDDGGDDDE